jgi:hypothetical protein
MTKQIKDSWAPFSIGVHYIVHRTNLAVQLLVDLNFIVWLKRFMMNTYGYLATHQSGILSF